MPIHDLHHGTVIILMLYFLVFTVHAVAYLAVLVMVAVLPAGVVLMLVLYCYRKKQKTSNGKCQPLHVFCNAHVQLKLLVFLLLNRQTPIYTTRRRTQVSGYMHGFVLIDVHWHMYSSLLIILLHCQTTTMQLSENLVSHLRVTSAITTPS